MTTAWLARWTVAMGLATLLLLGGCAAAGTIPSAFEQALGPIQPASVDSVFPAAILEAAAPRRSELLLFDAAHGAESSPSRVQLRIELNERRDSLLLEQRDASDRLLQREEYVRAPQGWALARSTTPKRAVLTEYVPPMLQFPRALAPQEPVERNVQVLVHPLRNPSSLQQRGRAANRVEFVGQQTVHTAQGQAIDASLVRLTFTGVFGLARVQRVTELWLAPRLGVVALRVRERVTALGALVSAIDQALLLARQDDASPTTSTSR